MTKKPKVAEAQPAEAEADARPMTAAEYRRLCAKLGLSVAGSRKPLGLSIRQVQRYAGGDDIPAPVAKLLRLMVARGITAAEVAAL